MLTEWHCLPASPMPCRHKRRGGVEQAPVLAGWLWVSAAAGRQRHLGPALPSADARCRFTQQLRPLKSIRAPAEGRTACPAVAVPQHLRAPQVAGEHAWWPAVGCLLHSDLTHLGRCKTPKACVLAPAPPKPTPLCGGLRARPARWTVHQEAAECSLKEGVAGRAQRVGGGCWRRRPAVACAAAEGWEGLHPAVLANACAGCLL